jgi:hypothetical protein
VSRFAEADRLLRLIVRERMVCERCGERGTDVAHIIRRRYNAVRCDERNVWWLCRNDHEMVDAHANLHGALVRQTIGWTVYEELLALAHAGPGEPLSVFWPAERARLRARCAELGIPVRGAA